MTDFQTLNFTRRPDWRPMLATYMARIARLRFRPGHHDCALFAAGAVEAMTGIDPAAALRGKYARLSDGQRLIRAAGFRDHLDMAAGLFPEVAPAQAAVGDLAMLPSAIPGDPASLGIIQGAGAYVLHVSGLVVVCRLHVERAFKV